MYGKAFSSMYSGSMVGRGALFFAVWGYVLANMVPDRECGMWVELNPKVIGFVLGEGEVDVEKVLGEMCEVDPQSRTKDEGGRKLVKLGEYAYRVVNGKKYQMMRSEEDRREQNRVAQAKFRAKSKPLPGEEAYVKAERNGASEEVLDRLSEPR